MDTNRTPARAASGEEGPRFRPADGSQLEAIGRVAAGVAHEINTPTQFISDAGHFAQEAVTGLLELIEHHRAALASFRHGADATVALADLDACAERIDAEFIRHELPAAISSILEGTSRIAEIVRAMKELTHPGSDAAVDVDVNHVIATAVRMTRSEVRYVAETELELGELPPVRGRPGELGKVMVNLIVNARDAIAEAARGAPGVIRIRSRVVDGAVRIEVEDDGVGIADASRARVFDPFFTTKPVGIGTGQGLSLSRRIVEQQYGGRIAIASERGRGTTITIDLPVAEGDAE